MLYHQIIIISLIMKWKKHGLLNDKTGFAIGLALLVKSCK